MKAAYCIRGNQWDCADCGKYPGVEFVTIGKGGAITGFVVYGIVAKDHRNRRIVMAFAGSSDIAQWVADVAGPLWTICLFVLVTVSWSKTQKMQTKYEHIALARLFEYF